MSTPRLSEQENLILRLLLSDPGQYAMELVRTSQGGIKKGSVYVTLQRMIDKHLIQAQVRKDPFTSGRPRPRYQATELGEKLYREWAWYREQWARPANRRLLNGS